MIRPRRLLLVRHGLPDYRNDLPGDIEPGPPLSEIGREQAAQAARFLASAGLERIHASPLARTHATAAVIAGTTGVPLRIDVDLREWHRSESLSRVGVRLTRWLVGWLRGDETCAAAVSHASPILAILRSALYLPHVNWHKPGHPEVLEMSSADRFEVSMASVFELEFTPRFVTARCLFHPAPRVQYVYADVRQTRLPRPVPGSGENAEVRRPNLLPLIGYQPRVPSPSAGAT